MTTHVFTDEMVAALGTDTDLAIAARFELPRQTVVYHRKKRGIPAFGSARKTATLAAVLISPHVRAKIDELAPRLIERYRAANLPISKLDDAQVIEIALNELLLSSKKSETRNLYKVVDK